MAVAPVALDSSARSGRSHRPGRTSCRKAGRRRPRSAWRARAPGPTARAGRAGDGIEVEDSNGNKLKTNELTSGSDDGIHLDSTDDTLVKANKLVSNTQDGLRIDSSATDTRISANVAKKNKDDGIHVDSTDSATVLTDNKAKYNDDYGIFAAEGVTDGGGNTASGNGTNCTPNIKCS